MTTHLSPVLILFLSIFSFSYVFSANTKELDISFLNKYDNREFTFQDDNFVSETLLEKGICDDNNSELNDSQNDYLLLDQSQEGDDFKTKFNSIIDSMPLFDKLSPDSLKHVTLPAGMRKTISDKEVTFAIIRAYFSVDYVMMDMLVRVKWKTEEDSIIELDLGAWNVKAFYGRGWPDEVNVVLLENENIPLGDKLTLQLNGNFDIESTGYVDMNSATYISFKCGEIESMKVHANGKVIVNDSTAVKKVVKEGDKFTIVDTCLFEVDFKTDFYLFEGDFYFSVFPEETYFSCGNSRLVFGISKLTLDFSTKKSDPAFLQSQSYHLSSTDKNQIWKGLYLQDLVIYLPDEYSTEVGGVKKRVNFDAHDLIVDNYGLSASLYVNDFDALNENTTCANMPFRFDQIGICITHNVINGFLIGGYISPSLLKDGEYVGFSASIEGDDLESKYALTVYYSTTDSTTDSILYSGKDVAFIPAKLKSISGTVTVITDSLNDITNASLEVSCKIVVTSDDFKGSSLQINNLILEVIPDLDLKLDSIDGSIAVTIDSNSVMKKWPIRIGYTDLNKKYHDGIAFTNGKLSIPITICLSDKTLSGSDSGTNFEIGGGGIFNFKWKEDSSSGSKKWKYDGVEVPEISVEASFKTFSFTGTAAFYDNGSNGRSGFAGNFDLKISASGDVTNDNPISIKGEVDFGSTINPVDSTTYRFWRVSAAANELGIPIYTNEVVLDGLAGGIAFHMKQVSNSSGSITFEPNDSLGLYLSFNTILELVEVADANAGFEMQFNKNFGLVYIAFTARVSVTSSDIVKNADVTELIEGYNEIAGTASQINKSVQNVGTLLNVDPDILNTIDSLSSNAFPDLEEKLKNSRFDVEVFMKYDAENKELYGKGTSYLNVLGVITGADTATYSAGSAYFYLNIEKPDEFFIHAGYRHWEMSKLGGVVKSPEINAWDVLGISVNIAGIKEDAKAYFLLGQYLPAKMPTPQELGFSKVPVLYKNVSNTISTERGSGVAFGLGLYCGYDSRKTFGDLPVYASLDAYLGFFMQFREYEKMMCKNQVIDDFGINHWYGNALAYAGLNGQVGLYIRKKEIPLFGQNLGVELNAGFPNPTWFQGTIYGKFTLWPFNCSYTIPFRLGRECNDTKLTQQEVQLPVVKQIYPEKDNSLSIFEEPYIEFNYDFNKPIYLLAESDSQKQVMLKCDTIRVFSGDNEITADIDTVWELNNPKKIFIKSSEGKWDMNSTIKIRASIYMYEMVNNVWTMVADAQDSVTNEPVYTSLLDTLIQFTTGEIETKLALSSVASVYPVIDQEYFLIGQSSDCFLKVSKQMELLDSISTIEYIDNDGNKIAITINADNFTDADELVYPLPEHLKNSTSYTIEFKNGGNEVFSYQFKTSSFNTLTQKINKFNSVISKKGSGPDNIIATCKYEEPFDKVELFGSKYYKDNTPLIEARAVLDQQNDYYKDIIQYIQLIEDECIDIANDFCVEDSLETIKKRNLKLACIGDWDYINNALLTNSIFPYSYNINPLFEKDIATFLSYVTFVDIENIVNEDLRNFLERYLNNGSYTIPSLFSECNLPVEFLYAEGDNSTKPQVLMKYNGYGL